MKITLRATNTFESPFWDNDGNELGSYNSITINEKEYKINFKGFKQWYAKSNQYDPWLCAEEFNSEGMEKWVSRGYEFAVMLRELMPQEIEIYYGFIMNLGGDWRLCTSLITSK